MQTQYEVNDFSRVTFLSKLNFSPFFYSLDMAHLSPSNGTEGSSRNVSSIWKVKDHGSHDVTWKPDTIFNFWHTTRSTQAVMVQLAYTHDV
jgi:hypothetical protein